MDIVSNRLFTNQIDYHQNNPESRLVVYNMEVLPELQVLAQIDHTASFEIAGDQLYTIDRVALIGDEQNPEAPIKFRIYDLNLFPEMIVTDSLDIPWVYQNYIHFYPCLKLEDTHVWASVRGYFHEIDLSGAEPQIISSFECDPDLPSSNQMINFVVANGSIFSQNGEIIDLNNRSRNIFNSGSGTKIDAEWINSLTCSGNYLFTANVDLGFLIYDIANPQSVSLMANHNNFQVISDLKIKNNQMYIVTWTDYESFGTQSGFYIFSLSDPDHPELLSLYDGNDDFMETLYIRGQYAYIGGVYGMKILDISNPANVQMINVISGVMAPFTGSFYDHYFYTFSNFAPDPSSFNVIDLADMNDPQLNPITLPAEIDLEHVYGMEVAGNYLYVLDSNLHGGGVNYIGGLKVFDLSDPLNPQWVNTINPDPLLCLRSMDKKGDILYITGNNLTIAADQYRIWSVDISDPTNPVILDTYSSDINHGITDIKVTDQYLFAPDLSVFDISDPQQINLISQQVEPTQISYNFSLFNGFYVQNTINGINLYRCGYLNNQEIPEQYRPMYDLKNYPNPFNPSTSIYFQLNHKGHVSLSVYNIRGQKVRTLQEGEMSEGQHRIIWDGCNENHQNMASGVYFYRMIFDNNIETKKMMLIK